MLLNHSPRIRASLGALFVLIGSISIQLSSVLSSTVFSTAGTIGTSGLRLTMAAVVLLAIARPRIRGLSKKTWRGILLYGIAMAAMNVLLYNALERLPLGTAVTLEFLGPLAVACFGAKGRLERFLPLVTLLGVALVTNPGGSFDLLGICYALGAAVAFAAYTLMAGQVGESSEGIQGLALSVSIGALLLTPFSIQAAPKLQVPDWLAVLASGLLGVALAFTLDFLATKLTSPRIVGTLFAIDPMAAAITGALTLRQSLPLQVVIGIFLVIISGAVIIWRSGRTRTEGVPRPD
ncbi:EamA family transporter [Psychromicrobium sp. YIM B11713]|uniref:EamA family transporter n=1 Tax=Psychromicrobium sp. YIM B11713 TaxID=3145233 RepID=UPI00374F4983